MKEYVKIYVKDVEINRIQEEIRSVFESMSVEIKRLQNEVRELKNG